MSSWQVFGLAGHLLAQLPSFIKPVPIERSFLLTAAGQLRILTGFPSSLCAGSTENHKVDPP
jgi:hypothetical protein